MPVKAVFFDLDDTLLDDGANYRVALPLATDLICAVYPTIAPAHLAAAFERVRDQFWAGTGGAPLTEEGSSDFRDIRRRNWRLALAEMGIDDPKIATRAADLFSKTRDATLTAFEDAEPVLSSLHGRVRLGIISNGPGDVQRKKIEASGFQHYFETIVTSGELGFGKPQPEIFRAALAALDVKPDEAFHVGDRLEADVAGANAAGLHSIWLNRRGLQRGPGHIAPDAEITSLAELPPLIFTP